MSFSIVAGSISFEVLCYTHMDSMGSDMLVSNVKKFFPFFVYPFTSDMDEAKILSLTPPTGPPSSSLVIFFSGKVLNTCCNEMLFYFKMNRHTCKGDHSEMNLPPSHKLNIRN